jgi:hypothetical protein
MAQPYDTDLEKLVKDKEDETGLEAPLFGEATRKAAFEGKHWHAIGKAWRDRAARTAFNAYRKRFPDKDNAYAARYDNSTKEAVLRGEHDVLLKRAVARCHMAGLDIWGNAYKYVALEVGRTTIETRLKELDATRQKKIWCSELRTEMDALKEEFVGQTFFDDEKVQNVVVKVGFYEGEDDDVHDPDPCLLCRFSADSDDAELEPLAPADVRDWIAGRSPPEPVVVVEAEKVLPPVPEPPKPPPPPPTRAGLKRAAAKTARSGGVKKFNEARSKKARRDKTAAKAESKNDVEPDDEAWAMWAPFLNVPEGDTRATAIDRRALRATIGRAALLDLAKVKTLLPRPLKPFSPQNPPRGGVPRERRGQLSRIGLAHFALVGDPDRAKMKLVVEFFRDRVDALEFVGKFGDGEEATAWLAKGVRAGRRRANCTSIGLGQCSDGTLSDHKKAVLAFLAGAADEASGELEAALLWFIDFIKNCFATRTVDLELVLYGAGEEGNVHDDTEEPTKSRGGVVVAGTVEFRAACSVDGDRTMSIHDKRGHLVTLPRTTGTGVVFVAGAHTRQRGIVKHRNDAGTAPGATLIVTLRADVSNAFERMSPVERLFAHAGIALF